MEYLKNQWKILLESFKDFDTRTIFIILYDLAFFLIAGLAFFIFIKPFEKLGLRLNVLDLNDALTSKESATSILSELKSIIFTALFIVILISLIIFVIMAVFKVLIWFTVTKTKFKAKDILKFVGVRIIWLLIGIAILIVSMPLIITIGVFSNMKLVVPMVFFTVILLLAWLYVTNIKNLMYIYFTKTKSFNCIKKAFKLGTKKVHLFISPYFVVIIISIIASQLLNLIFLPLSFIPETIQGIISLIILLLYAAWSRIYIFHIFKSIEKN